MHPDPKRPKDWISHRLKWARDDPYSREQQAEFAKCDVMCSGPEHNATATAPANPSYCILPIFHPPQDRRAAPANGYVSADGHRFECVNPTRLHQAYHVVFVIDSSGSMGSGDRIPLANTPVTLLSRLRHSIQTRLANDFTSTTDQLLSRLVQTSASGGTNFNSALAHAQTLIQTHWNSDKAPVLVFLSDGQCNLDRNMVYDMCRACVQLGKPLGFYSVSFGPENSSAPLRDMAQIAWEVYASAPRNIMGNIQGNPCAYYNAVDSIQLADTFLGISNSLHKPRASCKDYDRRPTLYARLHKPPPPAFAYFGYGMIRVNPNY
ncbi:von willebrand factor type A domain protein, partial [Rhizoctonia solani 123E]